MKGDQRRYYPSKIFPALGVAWFHERGVSDPEHVHERWQLWLKQNRTPEARFRKALALAVGVNLPAVGHYLTQWGDPATNRVDHLGLKTRKDLDEAAASLGCLPPYPFLDPLPRQEGGHLRILLVAELASVPSPRYHLTVLKSIVGACDRFNVSVEIRELRQDDPDIGGAVARLLRSSFPHGMIWLRLTPDQSCLDAINRYSGSLPCVLVHASRLLYPRPVIAHIVPDQTAIVEAVKEWAQRLPNLPSAHPTVVVVAMEAERSHLPFKPIGDKVPASIREERVELAMEGVRRAGLKPVLECVDTYAACEASPVLQTHPTALGYLCLSDEIAVSIGQLLAARDQEARGRILGFDGSDLAAEHQIPSFDQRLDDLGEEVIAAFIHWFRRPPAPAAGWPALGEVVVRLGPPSLLKV